MLYTAASRNDLYRLFGVIGIPDRVAAPIIELMLQWLVNNGPEWTTSRLKAMKVLYLQHYGGNKAFRFEDTDGIKYHRKDGTPYGPFRALWTMGSSHSIVNRALTVLMSYTSIKIKGPPTNGQLKKFLSAVEEPAPAGEIPPWDLHPRFRDAYSQLWYESFYDRRERWTNSSNKSVLYPPVKPEILPEEWDGNNRVTKWKLDDYLSLPETSIALDDHLASFLIWNDGLLEEFEPLINKALGPHAYPVRWRAIREGMLGFLERDFRKFPSNFKAIYDWSRTLPVAGKIGFIQERGCKLRAVANPLRVIQIVLSRMYSWLALASQRVLPWDCTWNQEKGVEWAHRKLAQGVKLYSFDLSNASDTIPLLDQLNFLRHVGPRNNAEFELSLSFYAKVSRSAWVFKRSNLHPIRPLFWTKGQPLGIVNSFGSFSQCHGARLFQLCSSLGLEDVDHFMVLGDDVVVSETLAPAYHDLVVNAWGCEISESKSITSEFLSEFASRLITPGRQLAGNKYPNSKRLFSVWNPLELPRKYGKKAVKLVPSAFRPMVQVATTLPKPHGLGWIPARDAVLPDAKEFESILFPNKLEQVSDFAYAYKSKHVGALFPSWEVRNTRKVDRHLDVEVAFSTEKNLGTLYGRFKLVFKTPSDKESTSPALPLSAVEDQWSVLHHNANLENDAYASYKPLFVEGEKVSTNSHVVGTRTHPFEVVQEPKNQTKVLSAKIGRWLRHWFGFVGKSLHKFEATRISFRTKRAKTNRKH